MNHNPSNRILRQLLQGQGGRRSPRIVLLIVGFVVSYVLLRPILNETFGLRLPDILDQGSPAARSRPQLDQPGSVATSGVTDGEQAILRAYEQQQSGLIVTASATVKKNLPDDDVDIRHQKAILLLPSGHSLLWAHNIDLAQRVPCKVGDIIEFRGEYEYSNQGGVIHWTHHDPAGRHQDGWVNYRGKVYD